MKSSIIISAVAAAATFAAITTAHAQAVTAPSPAQSATTSDMPKVTGPLSQSGYATTQSSTDWRSSKVVGLNVYNGKQEKIGDINELIIDASGMISHAVVGVGGFLGMGEKNVAIPFAAVKMSRDKDGKISAMVDSTKEALTAAPAFKYFNS